MTIRVLKSTNGDSWYATRIGQLVEVSHVEINRHPGQGLPLGVGTPQTPGPTHA